LSHRVDVGRTAGGGFWELSPAGTCSSTQRASIPSTSSGDCSGAQTKAGQRRPPTMRYHIEGWASSLRRTFAGLPSYDTKWKSRPRIARCRCWDLNVDNEKLRSGWPSWRIAAGGVSAGAAGGASER
jgi:hypothetical protein